jgi:tetratricopeptide (TPR) repeat protein
MKTARKTVDMDQLYNDLLTWLYERRNVRRARVAANRMAKLLAQFNPAPESIFVEECRSLVYEARGDLAKAIKHRKNEIRLIRRLHKLAVKTEHADYIFGQYDYDDLRERLDILAMLYREKGDLDKAIRTLKESRRFCRDHGIKFDCDDLLADYLSERADVYQTG